MPAGLLDVVGVSERVTVSRHRRWLRECDGHAISGVTDNIGRRSPIGAQRRPNKGGRPTEHGPAQEDDKKQPIDPIRARIKKGIGAPAAFMSCTFTCLVSMALLKRTHLNTSKQKRTLQITGQNLDAHGVTIVNIVFNLVHDCSCPENYGVHQWNAQWGARSKIGMFTKRIEARSRVTVEAHEGTVTVTAVEGRLEIPAEQGGEAIIIASAAAIVSLDAPAKRPGFAEARPQRSIPIVANTTQPSKLEFFL